jgi:hypothetical protein
MMPVKAEHAPHLPLRTYAIAATVILMGFLVRTAMGHAIEREFDIAWGAWGGVLVVYLVERLCQ